MAFAPYRCFDGILSFLNGGTLKPNATVSSSIPPLPMPTPVNASPRQLLTPCNSLLPPAKLHQSCTGFPLPLSQHKGCSRRDTGDHELVNDFVPSVDQLDPGLGENRHDHQFDFWGTSKSVTIPQDLSCRNLPATASSLPGQAHLPRPKAKCPGPAMEAGLRFSIHRIPSKVSALLPI